MPAHIDQSIARVAALSKSGGESPFLVALQQVAKDLVERAARAEQAPNPKVTSRVQGAGFVATSWFDWANQQVFFSISYDPRARAELTLLVRIVAGPQNMEVAKDWAEASLTESAESIVQGLSHAFGRALDQANS